MTSQSFTVTEKILKFWKAYYGYIPRCKLCGHEFELGDHVTSKQTTRKKAKPTNHYCTVCLEAGSMPYIET